MESNMGRRSANNLDLAAVGCISSPPRPQEIGDLDLSNCAAFATPRPLGQYHEQGHADNSLRGWYTGNNDPWNPVLNTGKGMGLPPSNLSNLQFTEYRNPAASECSTEARGVVPSDSGYASHGAKQSIANSSVFGDAFDRNADTQSLLGEINDLHPFGPPQWPHATTPLYTDNVPSTRLDNGHHVCGVCQKIIKTQSELKKHKLRHTKPHKCDYPRCPRGDEGFATPNDLSRHKRSCHDDSQAGGKRYKCTLESCLGKDKIWPRADNFRSHIKRTHKKPDVSEEYLDQFLYKGLPPMPEAFPDATIVRSDIGANILPQVPSYAGDPHRDFWPIPQARHLETEAGQAQPPEQVHITQPSSFFNEEFASTPSFSTASTDIQAKASPGSEPDEMNLAMPESKTEESESQVSIKRPAVERRASTDSVEQKLCTDNADICEPMPDHEMEDVQAGSSSSPSSPVGRAGHGEMQGEPFEDEAEEKLSHGDSMFDTAKFSNATDEQQRAIIEVLAKQGILKKHGYCKEHSGDDGKGKKQDSSTKGGCHLCNYCQKPFQRMCELKKHRKRHQKPYGCTFQRCGKRFGSKNDWKRHETTQHRQGELWRCDVKQSDAISKCCAKIFHKRELFKNHLTTIHAMKDTAEQEAKFESCSIGRNCEDRFWCGFCEDIVQNTAPRTAGNSAWTERFDHIDFHISGKNGFTQVDIDYWKDVDPTHGSASPESDGESGDPKFDASTSTRSPNPTGSETSGSEPGKRRRDTTDRRQTKRSKSSEKIMVLYCCQCNEQMPDISRVCADTNCQHRFCDGCSSGY